MEGGISSLIPHQISTESSEGAIGDIGGLLTPGSSAHGSPAHRTAEAGGDSRLISLDTSGETMDDNWSPEVGFESANRKAVKFELFNEKADSFDSSTGATLDNNWSPKESPGTEVLIGFESANKKAGKLELSNKRADSLDSSNDEPVNIDSSDKRDLSMFESTNEENPSTVADLISAVTNSGTVNDLLLDCDEAEQTPSTSKRDISPEHCSPKTDIKASSVVYHVDDSKLEGEEDAAGDESSQLLSFESSAVSPDEGNRVNSKGAMAASICDFVTNMASANDDQEQLEEISAVASGHDVPGLMADEVHQDQQNNLDRLGAILDKANQQQDTDVYCVDIHEEAESDVSADEEETGLLGASRQPTNPHAVMEDHDVAHLEGFFEGVADRMATLHLEKVMGVSQSSSSPSAEAGHDVVKGMTEGEDTAGVSGEQGTNSAAAPLIPKEKTQQKQLTVSGEEVDAMPQCV